jgi:hypothetical protein
MKKNWIAVLLVLLCASTNAQEVIGPKGTRYKIDSSKWQLDGSNLYNKNAGSIGIGTANPTAKLHTNGNLRFEGIGTNTTNLSILTADGTGNITTRTLSNMLADETITLPTGNNYRSLVTISKDVINNNVTGNTLQDITGLDFNVTAGATYRFFALIPYTSAAGNNGSRWTINAPASSLLNYVSRNTLSESSETIHYANDINIPAACNNSSTLNANMAIIQGIIKPTQNGTVQIRFASQRANTAITAKAGATLEYW